MPASSTLSFRNQMQQWAVKEEDLVQNYIVWVNLSGAQSHTVESKPLFWAPNSHLLIRSYPTPELDKETLGSPQPSHSDLQTSVFFNLHLLVARISLEST
jgi:hypothetical protein